MDIFFAYLPYLVAVSLSLQLIFAFVTHRRLYIKPSKTKLPPGKTGLPIIGESIQYGLACARGNLHGFINERMNKYSRDVFRTSLMGENMAVMCGAAGNKFLFSNENKLVKSWWPDSINKVSNLTSSDAADLSMSLKRHAQEFLKPEALQEYIPVMDSMAQQHIDTHWAPKAYPLVQSYSFAVACRLFMNVRGEESIAKIDRPFHLIVHQSHDCHAHGQP